VRHAGFAGWHLCGSYIAGRALIWNSNAVRRTFAGSNEFRAFVMTSFAADSEPEGFRHRARRALERIRDWPFDGNGPYSPLFCVSLLLAVGLIIGVGQ
jgi:hypothetical protein